LIAAKHHVLKKMRDAVIFLVFHAQAGTDQHAHFYRMDMRHLDGDNGDAVGECILMVFNFEEIDAHWICWIEAGKKANPEEVCATSGGTPLIYLSDIISQPSSIPWKISTCRRQIGLSRAEIRCSGGFVGVMVKRFGSHGAGCLAAGG
jgi:hypothetical protein